MKRTLNTTICGKDFRVIFKKNVPNKRWKGAELAGRCDPTGGLIWVSTDCTPEYMKEVLSHEIIHAVRYLTGQDKEKKWSVEYGEEEAIVKRLTKSFIHANQTT